MSIKETYGFELESYGLEGEHGYHDHKEAIEEVFIDYGCGDIIETVKGDGSLSNDGFELNCGIFEGFKNMEGALNQIIDVCHEESFIPRSPCALHIHNGGHSKPLNFSILSHMFDNVWSNLIQKNNSDIMWDNKIIRIPSQPLYKKCTTRGEFRDALNHLPISEGRGHTLRNRCNSTIEFRAIPLRLNRTYIKGWMKIYNGIKKRANHLSYQKMKELNKKTLEGDLNHKLHVLKKVSGLTNYEMFVLFHKINNESKEKWDNLKSEKYNYVDILRGHILDPTIKTTTGLKQIFDIKGVSYNKNKVNNMEVFYPTRYSPMHFSKYLITKEEIRSLNILTYNNQWGYLNDQGFIFRETRPSIMLEHCINKGVELIDPYNI